MACSGGGLVGLLCTAFVPTQGLGSRVAGLRDALESRFPFSLAADLSGFWSGGAGVPPALPSQLSWFPLAFDQFGSFFATVKLVVTVLLVVGFLWYLIDRLTPQVTI